MRPLKRQLPGLNGLVTFEAAARHLGFTRAADELCVSQAAVSRQIRRLEEQLGTALFVRRHRALELTDAGRRLHQAVSAAFEQIAAAAGEIVEQSSPRQIQVATTVAFATYWFVPRLNRFRERYPEVDVRVLASDRHQDHLADQVDLALVCGPREAPGWSMRRLFSEVVFPVCSPGYLAGHPIDTLADLTERALLHLDRRHWDDIGWEPVDWTRWLDQFGVDYRPRGSIVTFNNYPMLVEAALRGEGVALGWRHLSDQLIADGRLVRPLPQSWDFERDYYLVLRERPKPWPEALALRDWLCMD